METANMIMDFKNNNSVIFGEPKKLIATKSGHYALPISPYSKILNNIVTGTNPNINLITISISLLTMVEDLQIVNILRYVSQ